MANTLHLIHSLFLLLFACFILMMFMGLHLIECGMSQTKNTTSVLVKSTCSLATICLSYFLIGRHINAGEYNPLHWILNLFQNNHLPLTPHANLKALFHPNAAMFFKLLLPSLLIAIVSNATTERVKLWSFVLFTFFLGAFIYPVEAHWVWGNGLLYNFGFLDQAGSGVIYLTAGICGLCGNFILGPRFGAYNKKRKYQALPCANLPLAWQGLFFIFIGVLGVNAGNFYLHNPTLNSEALSLLFFNTLLATLVGFLTTLIFHRVFYASSDLTIGINGSFASLAAIAANPSTPNNNEVILLSITAGLLALLLMRLLNHWRIDDATGSISSFIAGGMIGLLAASITYDPSVVHAISKHWYFWQHLLMQSVGMLLIMVWASSSSMLAWLLVKYIMGLRLSKEIESRGLDIYDCGILSYPEFTGPI